MDILLYLLSHGLQLICLSRSELALDSSIHVDMCVHVGIYSTHEYKLSSVC